MDPHTDQPVSHGQVVVSQPLATAHAAWSERAHVWSREAHLAGGLPDQSLQSLSRLCPSSPISFPTLSVSLPARARALSLPLSSPRRRRRARARAGSSYRRRPPRYGAHERRQRRLRRPGRADRAADAVSPARRAGGEIQPSYAAMPPFHSGFRFAGFLFRGVIWRMQIPLICCKGAPRVSRLPFGAMFGLEV